MPGFGDARRYDGSPDRRTSHPELKPGEVWLTNIAAGETGLDFVYKNKRVGKKAYDDQGREIEGMAPLFVSEQEWKEHHKGE